MKRQQRRMELDHAVLRDRAEFGWGEEQNIGHHAEIRLEVGECALGLLARIFGEPMDGQTPFLSCRDEWVGSRSRPFRCGKSGGDLVPACDERVKHGFAKGLLTDDDDAHFLPSENVPRLVLCRSRAATPPTPAQFHVEAPCGKSVAPAPSAWRAGSPLGNSKVTAVPRPTSLRIDAEPPDWRAKPYTMLSPSPVPLPASLVVKNGSKARAATSGGIPVPVSEISKPTKSPEFAVCSGAPLGCAALLKVRMRNSPPPGIASRALIARLMTASSSWVASASTGHRSGTRSAWMATPLPTVRASSSAIRRSSAFRSMVALVSGWRRAKARSCPVNLSPRSTVRSAVSTLACS